MPELPEVETIRRGLEQKLVGRVITRVNVLESFIVTGSASGLAQKLAGQKVSSVERHGKYLFLRFPAVTVSIHLRMTGQLLFVPSGAPADKHVHIRVEFENGGEELRYRDIRKFGRWKVVEGSGPNIPDAWLAGKEQILAALKKRRGMIKHALLSQNVISGLGNIYVDESLHRAKIHPKRKLERINAVKMSAFYDGMKAILDKSIEIGGTSFRDYVDTKGARGGYRSWLVVYGRAGAPCACGGTIRRIVVAGRGTHYCPRCQK